jgi:TRAP-type C4-dicarboxylate transport system substrate-binding protein
MTTITWAMLETLEEYQVLAVDLIKQFNEITNGEVKIDIKLLSRDPENPLKEIEDGNIDLYQITSDQLSFLVPKSEWLRCWDVPFLFRSDKHAERYVNHERTKEKLMALETDTLLPLATFSYAGGFRSVVKQRGTEVRDLINLTSINMFDKDLHEISETDFLGMYASLPNNVLMYELNKFFDLSEELKSMVSVELTNHTVVARVTMISKAMLGKLPEKYRDAFVTLLFDLLTEERQVIYRKSEANAAKIREDKHIEVIEWDLDKKDSARRLITPIPRLNEEIEFIQSLLE